MGAPTIITRTNPARPICLARDRFGILYGVDGLDRGFRWDGQTTAAEDLGIDAPVLAPTVGHGSGGAATAGDYLCGYRFTDDNLPVPIPSSLSPTTSVTASANDEFTWSALSAAATTNQAARVAMVELYRSLADETTTLYLVIALGASGVISTVTTSAGTNKVTTTKPHNLADGAVLTIASVTGGSSINGSGRVVTVVDATSFTIGTSYSADGAGGTWFLTGYTDAASDTTLAANAALPILKPDGTPNAYEYTAPPDYLGVLFALQDRAFYCVAVTYATGTVSTTAASTTLTGTNTVWTSAMVGRYVYVLGEPAPLIVDAYVSATQLTLTTGAVNTLSTVGYAIKAAPSERNRLYYSEVDAFEGVNGSNTVDVQENTADADELTGAVALGAFALLFQDRHVYRLSYVRQPNIDASVQLVAERGAVNFRCAVAYEGICYALDQRGVYSFDGYDQPKPLNGPLQNLWQEGLIDWTTSQWFHASVDPELRLVKFWFNLAGDGATRPLRCYAYHIDTGRWYPEKYVTEMGGGCASTVASRERYLVGGERDNILLTNEGVTDLLTSAILGTATGATSSTLSDSGGGISVALGTPVSITGGAGKGQTRKVTGSTSTQATVSPNWTTTPDATSTYCFGAIPWNAKFGRYLFLSDAEAAAAQGQNRRAVKLFYSPTANPATLDIRAYLDSSASPANNVIAEDLGNGITTDLDSPDAVLDMRSARSALAAATGLAQTLLGGRLADESVSAPRALAVELRGFSTQDRILLYELTIYGVRQ